MHTYFAQGDAHRCCFGSSQKYQTFGQGSVVFCHPGRNSLKLPSLAVLPRYFYASQHIGARKSLQYVCIQLSCHISEPVRMRPLFFCVQNTVSMLHTLLRITIYVDSYLSCDNGCTHISRLLQPAGLGVEKTNGNSATDGGFSDLKAGCRRRGPKP